MSLCLDPPTHFHSKLGFLEKKISLQSPYGVCPVVAQHCVRDTIEKNEGATVTSVTVAFVINDLRNELSSYPAQVIESNEALEAEKESLKEGATNNDSCRHWQDEIRRLHAENVALQKNISLAATATTLSVDVVDNTGMA